MTENTQITEDTMITGAEWRDFYLNHWPGKDWYIDDVAIEFEDENGTYVLSDDGTYRLGDFGYVCWQGPEGKPHKWGKMFPVADFFRTYKQGRGGEIVLSIAIDETRRGALEEFVAAQGGRIV